MSAHNDRVGDVARACATARVGGDQALGFANHAGEHCHERGLTAPYQRPQQRREGRDVEAGLIPRKPGDDIAQWAVRELGEPGREPAIQQQSDRGPA